MGPGDLHEPGFESTEVTTRLTTVDTQGIEKIKGHCVYSISFYSSSQFREKFKKDFWFAPLIATAFALVCCAFIRYDRMVNHRIDKVIRTAARFNAILGKMYASNLRSLAASSPRKKKALSRCEWRSQMEPLTILEDVSSSAVDGADEIIMEQKGPPAPLFQDGNLRRPHPSFEVV